MRQILKVNICDNKEYLIDISDSSFEKLNQAIFEYTKNQKRLFVISKKVYKLYKNEFDFAKEEILLFPDGEQEKNYRNYLKIINRAAELG